jgi:ribonuclease D
VTPDPAVVELSRRQPRDTGQLEHIRGLQPHVARRRGRDIVAAIERGRVAEPIRWDDERVPSDPRQAPLVALAEAVVRARAQEADLAYELVASRADLVPIVRSVRSRDPEPDVRTLHGWRRELVGAELLELLAGGVAVSVDASGMLRAEPRAQS